MPDAEHEPWWTDDPKERRDHYMVRNDPRWRVDDMRLKRCNNCGLLGQQRWEDRQLVPMLEWFRGRDDSVVPPTGLDREYEKRPVCAASAKFFPEYSSRLDIPKWNALLAEDMSHCASFIQWVSGLSIKDHQEMLSQQKMLEWQREESKADRDWRAEEAEHDREWRAYQSNKDDKWRTEEANAERTWRSGERTRDNRWRALEMFLIATGIIVAATIAVRSNGSSNSSTLPVSTAVAQSTPVTLGGP